MTHIALLSGEYPPQPGGIGDYTRMLGHSLHTQGVQVSIITGGHAAAAPDEGLRVWRGVPAWGWQSWQVVLQALAALHPDLLHIQYQAGAYAMHPAINLLPLRLRPLPLPVVVTFHDLLYPYLFPKAHWLGVRQWVLRRLACDAHATIATNPADAAGLRRLCPMSSPPPATIPIGSNIAVQPPAGYQRAAWRARLGIAASTPVIAYFGLASPAKGIDTLLHALEHLPDVALLLIGGAADPQHPTYASAVQAQVQALQARGRQIIGTGHAAAADVSAHLLAADVVALPFRGGASFRSGSLLAALSHGIPVVTTRGSEHEPAAGFPQLVDGENVLLVPPADPAALAQALHRCLHDAALHARLAQQARQVAAFFGWETVAQQHLRLYRQLTTVR